MISAVACFVNVQFLGYSLAFMLVYVWSRRHQYVTMSFLGLFNFTAPYLPYVLIAFSMVLGANVMVDLLGLMAGHIYYFLEDVYPHMTNNRRVLKTPAIITSLFGDGADRVAAPVLPPRLDPARFDADRAARVAGAHEHAE